MPLLKEALKLREVVFGTTFNVDITPDLQLGEKFYRAITRAKSDLFTTKLFHPGMPLVFIHERNNTQLVITEKNLQFVDRKTLNSQNFLDVSWLIGNKLVEIFECNEENFRIIGKIYRYSLTYPSIVDSFEEVTGVFKNKGPTRLSLEASLKEDNMNVHLQIGTAPAEEGKGRDMLLVSCDVNNTDQERPHSLDLMKGVFPFADMYNLDRFPQLLTDCLNASN